MEPPQELPEQDVPSQNPERARPAPPPLAVRELRTWEHRPTTSTYEATESVEGAIEREQQLKSGGRARQIALIAQHHPEWRELSEEWEERETGDGSREG